MVRKQLGYFNDKNNALKARKQAELAYYGQFAK